MKVTFICCHNNNEELNSMLLPSFNMLDKNSCNIILIDAFKEGYKSAAEAYNRTIEKRKDEIGDILIFCHQDIAFDNITFLQNITSELTENPNQIIGFAGINATGTVFSNLKYQESKQFITKNQTKEKIQVISLDECCFAMTKTVYENIRFDECVCNHWHLYAVELCYNAQRYGIPSYVMPNIIYHKKRNNGGMYCDNHFLKSMWRLIEKYKKDFNYIYAPCYICSTNKFIAAAKIARTSIKNLLH
jgi:GT2 family glycosyltransferase